MHLNFTAQPRARKRPAARQPQRCTRRQDHPCSRAQTLAAWALLQRVRLLRLRPPVSKPIAAAKRRSFRRAICMHKPIRRPHAPYAKTYRDSLSDFCFGVQAHCDDFSCCCAKFLTTSRAVCLPPRKHRGSLQLVIEKQFYSLERLNGAKERAHAGAQRNNTQKRMR